METTAPHRSVRPGVSIGFVAKEKFHLAAQALDTLLATLPPAATLPCEVIVVDCRTPARYRAQVAAVIARWPQVSCRVVFVGHYLQPNQARNLAARYARHPWLAFVENDSFVTAGWLEALLETCRAYPDGCVATAEVFEGPVENRCPHVDVAVTQLRVRHEGGRVMREFVRDESAWHRHRAPGWAVVGGAETHVFACSREVLERIGGFDEHISTREHCSLALSLNAAGIPLVVNGHARVGFFPGPPIYFDERPFFRFVWNLESARRSLDYLRTTWNLVNFHGSLGFVRSQVFRTHRLLWRVTEAVRRRSPAANRYFDDEPIVAAADPRPAD